MSVNLECSPSPFEENSELPKMRLVEFIYYSIGVIMCCAEWVFWFNFTLGETGVYWLNVNKTKCHKMLSNLSFFAINFDNYHFVLFKIILDQCYLRRCQICYCCRQLSTKFCQNFGSLRITSKRKFDEILFSWRSENSRKLEETNVWGI